MEKRKRKIMIWLSVIAGLGIVAVANWHLVYVAFTSQPDCVAHVRPGASRDAGVGFSAAQSSCTP
jgi:hypothetical protein